MKKILLLAIVAVLLAVTNPSKSDYTEWAVNQLKQQGNEITQLGVSLLGKPILDKTTVVHNYVIFSTFETNIDKKHTTLGILKNFVPLD